LLGLAAAMGLASRRADGPWLARLRAALVLVAVLAGVAVAAREAVQAVNLPSAEAAARANPLPATADSVERGRGLYLANCAACHGTTGAGDGVTAAGWLPPIPPFDEVVPNLPDGQLAFRIAVGTAGTRMPAFASTLSENDRWDLVNYLRTLWPRSDR
jgi:mono/diheme cytochrome c family protein